MSKSTLRATNQMADVRLRLMRDGRITQKGIQSGKALGKTLEEIEESMQKVRERRASLAMQADPRAFREDEDDYHPVNPSDPTPQWRAKAGAVSAQVVGRGEVVPIRRYKAKHIVEQHGDKLDMSKRSALERFMQDATYAARIGVMDPNRAGGYAAPGSKLGGLGNVPQHIRDGHARHEWVWGRIPPDLQRVANALVTREMVKADGTPFSLEDFGAQMFPSVADKNRRWGAAAGALW
ncbi:MAG: hypothetical protein ACKO0Z_09240, partial [Betaproteobacteria bacterium]